jgi:nucleoside-diphosphate-sugar epimerase
MLPAPTPSSAGAQRHRHRVSDTSAFKRNLPISRITACSNQGCLMKSKRTFLITGATGFLGGAVAVAALRAGYGRNLRLLVRASAGSTPATRLFDNLRRLGATERELSTLGTDFLLEADLANPRGFEKQPQLRSIERVIHAAALPTFSNNPGISVVNVDGTLALARALDPSVLRRFLFVGTAMAVGPSLVRGSVVMESEQLGVADDHLVPYTASKAEAERRLRSELPDLPLVVARPSIVVGHTELGVAPSQSIFWVFLIGHMLGAFTCELKDFIDVIPADWCAKVLLHLSISESLEHDVYHVSAGQESSVTFAELDEVLAKARQVTPMSGNYRRLEKAEMIQMLPRLRALVPDANRRLLIRALQLYGGFAELSYVFDSHRLRQEGVDASPRFTSYLPHCVETSRGISIADQMKWDFK